MTEKKAKIMLRGYVQAAEYRVVILKIAHQLGLKGYVENLLNGDVRIVCEGDDNKIEKFIEQIKITSDIIQVEEVNVSYEDSKNEFTHFEVKVSDIAYEMFQGYAAAGKYFELIFDRLGNLKTDIDTVRRTIKREINALKQERLLLYEKNMIIQMFDCFKHYDDALTRLLEEFPYEESVFIMMPFEKSDIRLRQITNTIKQTLRENGLNGWRADDSQREIMDNIWDNVVVNMLSCKYGIAVLVDRKVLDRYTDREITVFNANISLEIGFMKSRGLDVLILKDKQLKKLPTDIVSKLYKEFNFNDPENDVRRAITKWVNKIGIIDNKIV